MIQELTDRGPSRTYPVYYLDDCFDYAVNDYGAEGSEVAELFCLSGVAREFERGNAWVVSGKSGVELFALIAERSGYQSRPMPNRTYRFEKTPDAVCTTPGTKPRRNVWLASSAIWRRKRPGKQNLR